MERIDDGRKVTRLIIEADIDSAQLLSDGELGYSGKLRRWVDMGDFVLVDPRAYFEPKVDDAGTVVERKRPFVWGHVYHLDLGSAAAYAIKVTFDEEAAGFEAYGQYRPDEILAVNHVSKSLDQDEPEYWRDYYNWG